jgi:hypothetical protein
LDSHADTCGFNNVAKIIEYYGPVAEVSGFSNNLDVLKDIPFVKAAIAYDNPYTAPQLSLGHLTIQSPLYFDCLLLNHN